VGFWSAIYRLRTHKTEENEREVFQGTKSRTIWQAHTIIQDPDGNLISIAEISSKPEEGFDLIGYFGTH
jgi:hypothetical protein